MYVIQSFDLYVHNITYIIIMSIVFYNFYKINKKYFISNFLIKNNTLKILSLCYNSYFDLIRISP